MSTRDEAWPQGTPNWVDLSSPDVATSNEFYRALFGWEADADSPVAPQVSDAGAYGFIASSVTANGSAIPIRDRTGRHYPGRVRLAR